MLNTQQALAKTDQPVITIWPYDVGYRWIAQNSWTFSAMGYLVSGGAAALRLHGIPASLSCAELKMFLRKHGAEICGSGSFADDRSVKVGAWY